MVTGCRAVSAIYHAPSRAGSRALQTGWDAVIQVEELTKLYGETLAVDHLQFQVAGGDILGLVGPNGAGKTTTLRIISGVLPATSGRVMVAGHDVATESLAAKRALAIVPDDAHLFDALTVDEHLEFTARLYRLSDWQPLATQLLERFEIADRRRSLVDELSRGMRQKVAVACALLHQPQVLLLDEPLTGLDPRGIRTLHDALRTAAGSGAAVMVSSHLLGQIEGLCSHFLIIRAGKRLHYGTPEEIKAELPALRQDASLEEIFFHATEGDNTGGDTGDAEVPNS